MRPITHWRVVVVVVSSLALVLATSPLECAVPLRLDPIVSARQTTVSGLASSGATVQVLVNDQVFETKADAQGRFQVSSRLRFGRNHVEVKAFEDGIEIQVATPPSVLLAPPEPTDVRATYPTPGRVEITGRVEAGCIPVLRMGGREQLLELFKPEGPDGPCTFRIRKSLSEKTREVHIRAGADRLYSSELHLMVVGPEPRTEPLPSPTPVSTATASPRLTAVASSRPSPSPSRSEPATSSAAPPTVRSTADWLPAGGEVSAGLPPIAPSPGGRVSPVSRREGPHPAPECGPVCLSYQIEIPRGGGRWLMLPRSQSVDIEAVGDAEFNLFVTPAAGPSQYRDWFDFRPGAALTMLDSSPYRRSHQITFENSSRDACYLIFDNGYYPEGGIALGRISVTLTLRPR